MTAVDDLVLYATTTRSVTADGLAPLIDAVRAEVAAEEGASTPSPPSRFSASPADVDRYLRLILCEDTYLNFQRAIGERSVVEAAKDQRMQAAEMQLRKPMSAYVVRQAADRIDPLKGGGRYPSILLCSMHDGFGPCPGAPRCTPSTDEAGDRS